MDDGQRMVSDLESLTGNALLSRDASAVGAGGDGPPALAAGGELCRERFARYFEQMAPEAGLEPATRWLTVNGSGFRAGFRGGG